MERTVPATTATTAAKLRTVVRAARGAVTFLTRVPVGGFPYSADEWRWTSAWFPAVGALLGAAYALVFRLVAAPAGTMVAAVLVLVAALLVTGAFHEDGLADTADALGGAHEPTRVLEILKDSRIGAFGASALGASFLLRVALLARLGPRAPVALVLTEALSRLPSVWLMVALPYVTSDAAAKSRVVTRAGVAQALLASLWPLAAAAAAVLTGELGLAHVVALATTATACGLLCGWRFHVRVGGVTGDFLGATQQVTVCALLLVLALVPA
jgi:adenosylcobinamide-GDP ribazoletransferase